MTLGCFGGTSKSGQNGQGTSLATKISLMIALCIPVILETLDYTVVATAQPHIASIFHSLNLQSYIGTAYLLSSTVFIPFFGSLADIYGRHPTLQLSLLFFMIGSALSTGAHDMPTMLAGRGIAGIGAAGLTAVVRIILADSRSLDDNNWQTTMLMILYTIGYCVGPVIGGALVSVSFRWIFAINLPACTAAAILCFFILPRIAQKGKAPERLPVKFGQKESWFDKLLRIDWVGAVLFMGGGILLLLALNWGSTEAWRSAKVIVSFVVGGILFIAFGSYEVMLVHYRDSPVPPPLRMLWADPLVPMNVFLSYDACAVLYSNFVQGMVMMVMFYFVAIFMVIVEGVSATKAGVQLIYFAPGMGAGSFLSMQIIRITRQPRRAVQLGSLVMVVGLGFVSMGVDQNKRALVDGFMVMTGAGVGLSVASSILQVRFTQSEAKQARVTALTLFMRSFGGTVGLAQCGAVMNAKVSAHIVSAVRSGALSATGIGALGSGTWSSGSLGSLQTIDALPGAVQDVVHTAFTIGTRYSFISLVPWAGLAFITSMFLGRIPATDEKSNKVDVEESSGGKVKPDGDSTNALEMQEVRRSSVEGRRT
ncbi:MFS general substrate transporter [Heliocybe sulcata]|uniref:MFS general substrate transporter n=1 Tax=Heliocybe sulcata TaxID=5364 RepID=A0A5C3N0H8_9AGAM|nr:MFS general substrate transporter [Heliocybe sulcata]